MTKIAGPGSESGSISQRNGSEDPDPHLNVMDPEHCFQGVKLCDFGVTLPVNSEGKVSDPSAQYIGTEAWSPMEVRGTYLQLKRPVS